MVSRRLFAAGDAGDAGASVVKTWTPGTELVTGAFIRQSILVIANGVRRGVSSTEGAKMLKPRATPWERRYNVDESPEGAQSNLGVDHRAPSGLLLH
jgi:hypothetical protein